MRRIVVSIQNGLLAEGLTEMLRQSGEFEPYRVAADQKKRTVPACMACGADLVLMEVSQAAGSTMPERMEEVAQLLLMVPDCRIVFLCDENISPEIARNVVSLKKKREIDAFYYSSVTGKYLIAALYAL
jgi:DNA-binding NarL/FixJ family response regulator